MSDEPRIIKKYQNRCLYDTQASAYISINDLKQMIYEGKEFVVHQAKSKKDITRSVLLQIIADEENGNEPMFTPDMLMKLIRMHGASMQNVYGGYLQQSMDIFESKSKEFFDQMGKTMSNNPMTMWADLTQQNLQHWQEFQQSFFTGSTKPKK